MCPVGRWLLRPGGIGPWGFVGFQELLVAGQGLDAAPFVAAGDAGAVSLRSVWVLGGMFPVLGPDTLAAHDFAF